MSWTRTASKDLINLDKVQTLDIRELDGEPAEGEPTHCLVAVLELPMTGDDCEVIIKSGTHNECSALLDAIARKLHLVP